MTTLSAQLIAAAKAFDAELRRRDATIAELQRSVSMTATKVRNAYKQRDVARGRAREYKSYAAKYQRELAALRKGRNA